MLFRSTFGGALALLSSLDTISASPSNAPQTTAEFHSYNRTALLAKNEALLQLPPKLTISVRKGLVVGATARPLNASIAQHGPIEAIPGALQLQRRGELFKLPNGFEINLLGDSLGTLVFAVGICAFVPGCSQYVAGNLGFANAGTFVRTVTAVAAGGGAVHTRDDVDYEDWACEPYNGHDEVCNDSGYTVPTVMGIANNDGTSLKASAWSITDPNDGTVMGMYWHCENEDGDCALIDNGPSAGHDIGSAEGH